MIDQYAVIGNPISHSRSPEIHAAFAAQLGHRFSYVRIEAPLDNFVGAVDAFRRIGGIGANVTVPFKLEAFALATKRSPRAVIAGAANTLCFGPRENNAVFADNTDGVGLVRDIRENLGQAITGRRVLMLGAGGAARSVLAALAAESPAELAIANRTQHKAQRLLMDLSPCVGDLRVHVIDVAALPGHRFDLVINATSASLFEDLPLIPPSCFDQHALAYDMMYGKGLTPFLALARSAGARTVDGVGMLVEQAAEACWLWRGVRPDTKPVISALKVVF